MCLSDKKKKYFCTGLTLYLPLYRKNETPMLNFSLLPALLLATALPTNSYTQDDPPPLVIEIGQNPGDSNGNRAPALIPIECYYYSSLSSVVACFQYSLETVNAEVKNLDSGSVSSQNVNGNAGIHVIPVSSSPGPYSITFTLADGTEYVGTYIIE